MDIREIPKPDNAIYIDDEEIQLPTKRVICPVCDGKGTHVNPSIDSHGISPDEFAEDPDFAEEYFSGRYDVVCNYCNGNKVVEEPDFKALTPEQHKAWNDERDAEAADRACAEAERRMGC